MPTPVAAARQCLTQESAAVLDEAVAVARRRGHAQTTSLHMVSSLLSLPNSSLREACTRTRSNAYSTRVQFKALELSLSVSLDRLPSSQATKPDAPPVSNSLMAAIKRSQANQRRQPENFSFYQQQQQQYSSSSSSSSVPLVKVELQNLIVSILDDPLVSRVLAEAGFRSCDIKMATIRPGNILGYSSSSRYKRPNPNTPLFICNLTTPAVNEMINCGSRGFSFPFMGCFTGDNNSNSKSDSNSDTRRIGEVMLRDKKKCPLLLGASATDALAVFLETAKGKKGSSCGFPDELSGLCVESMRDEISRYLNGDGCDDGQLRSTFEKVKREVERGRVLVDFGDLGALLAASDDDRRLKFLVGNIARLVEVYARKLWLIGTATTYEVYFKILNRFPSIEEDWQLGVLPVTSSIKFSMGGSYPRSSLMESFVPLGGFFSMPPETKSPLSNACHLCNEKYEQELAAVSNSEKHKSWGEAGTHNGLSFLKGKDDRMLLNTKIAMLQKKWDNICLQHHQQRAHDHHIPRVLGFQVVKETSNVCNANSIGSSTEEQGNMNASSTLSTHLQTCSSLKELSSSDVPAKENKQHHHLHPHLRSSNLDSSIASVDEYSPTCPSSISDDLGLEVEVEVVETEANAPHISNRENQYGSGIVKDPKLLYTALLDRVGHQEDAIRSIVQTLTQRQNNDRGNVWINIKGGDALSKKKLGLALAEILNTSNNKISLVYIDLSFSQEISHINSLLNSQITNKYDVTMRATVVDYLVEKLSKKPCLVFLNNLDKADLVVQNSLLHAFRAGRFTDWCGREANVANSIFIGATNTVSSEEEDDAVNAKGFAMQIVIRFDMSDDLNSMNKRKLVGRGRSTKRPHKALDLNLNLEGNNEISCEPEWMERFDREVDLTVDFEEYDFAKLCEKIMKSVEECVKNAAECECAVEIEGKAMQQMMGAAYLYGMKSVEDWIEEVVRKGFVEGMGKYSISGRSIVTIKAVGEKETQQGLLPARVTMK